MCVSFEVAFPNGISTIQRNVQMPECLCQHYIPMALLENQYSQLPINTIAL
jgi:hypothetical protein